MRHVLTILVFFGLIVACRFSSAAEPVSHDYKVVAPPVEWKLDPFYKKCVMIEGLPIASSEKVNDYALKEAAYIVDSMLVHRRDIIKALVDQKVHIAIMAYDEFQTTLPEYAYMKNDTKTNWDRRCRGMGAEIKDGKVTPGSGAEENLLCFPGDPYPTENIFLHEFAHTIHEPALAYIDKNFNDKLKSLYEEAKKKGLWKDTYAATDHFEYWAEGVQSWFDNNRPKDYCHNGVDTRKKLKEYDPDLCKLIEDTFGNVDWKYIYPSKRSPEGLKHLEGYDFSKSPTFKWPETIKYQSLVIPKANTDAQAVPKKEEGK